MNVSLLSCTIISTLSIKYIGNTNGGYINGCDEKLYLLEISSHIDKVRLIQRRLTFDRITCVNFKICESLLLWFFIEWTEYY